MIYIHEKLCKLYYFHISYYYYKYYVDNEREYSCHYHPRCHITLTRPIRGACCRDAASRLFAGWCSTWTFIFDWGKREEAAPDSSFWRSRELNKLSASTRLRKPLVMAQLLSSDRVGEERQWKRAGRARTDVFAAQRSDHGSAAISNKRGTRIFSLSVRKTGCASTSWWWGNRVPGMAPINRGPFLITADSCERGMEIFI